MGLEIKKNSKGLFKLTSTVSDESYHPDKKWISVDEAKKVLIENEIWSFIEKIIEIDECFPGSYYVNGSYDVKNDSKTKHLRWMLDNAYGEDGGEKLEAKFKEVIKRLEIDLDFGHE